MSPTLTIAKRELRANFDSAALYVVVCICLPVLALFFFYYEGGFWQADRASFERLFVFAARGLSAVVVPVVTMRLVAEERLGKRNGVGGDETLLLCRYRELDHGAHGLAGDFAQSHYVGTHGHLSTGSWFDLESWTCCGKP